MTEHKRFELIDDYIISYDGDYFDLHKLSDIRSFVTVVGYVIDENEQLKQQLISISHLIDNKIDEFKNGDYGDLPCNTIHMFLDLKEEFKERFGRDFE